jgi:mannose-6-phosphate isomerase class I
LEGEGSLKSNYGSLKLTKGDSIFLPKGMGAYHLIGRLQILISEV